jgi:sec-independent protein translocase protein TatA
MSSVGIPELLLLAVVALLFFGPKRLPEMARGLGHGMREFKDSVSGITSTEATPAALPAVAAQELHAVPVPAPDAEAKAS